MAVSGVLKGWRTITAALSFLVIGLLSAVGTLDLTPLIALFVKDPAYLGAAMVCIGALLGYLRWITTTPMFHKHEDVDEAPEDRPRCTDAGV